MAKSLNTAIDVMRAAERGEEIEFRKYGTSQWSTLLPNSNVMSYNWFEFDYRVKPKPQKFWVVFNDKNQLVAATYIPLSDRAKIGWMHNKCVIEEYERKV